MPPRRGTLHNHFRNLSIPYLKWKLQLSYFNYSTDSLFLIKSEILTMKYWYIIFIIRYNFNNSIQFQNNNNAVQHYSPNSEFMEFSNRFSNFAIQQLNLLMHIFNHPNSNISIMLYLITDTHSLFIWRTVWRRSLLVSFQHIREFAVIEFYQKSVPSLLLVLLLVKPFATKVCELLNRERVKDRII